MLGPAMYWSSNDVAPNFSITAVRHTAGVSTRTEWRNAFTLNRTLRRSTRGRVALRCGTTPHCLACEENNSVNSDPRNIFQPFVSSDLLKRRANDFVAEFSFQNPERILEVRPLSEEVVDACADLLTNTFADSMGYISAYRNFLFRQIRKYLRDHSAIIPKSVILVARLSASGNADCQVIGAVEVSFSESTRSKNVTLNPPSDRPYLCNMAIEAEHRRRGYGRALLEAAERLIVHMGESCVYLHARCKDKPALRLYEDNGYTVVAEDSFLVALVGLDRRKLFKKQLDHQLCKMAL
jgi:ribosomal protein S18 acetylase RimI-like enzyme